MTEAEYNVSMTFFADGLKNSLETKVQETKLKKHEKHILNIINSADSKHRTKKIAMMERQATVALVDAGMPPNKAIDWSSIDWKRYLEPILSFIKLILPFILMMGNEEIVN